MLEIILFLDGIGKQQAVEWDVQDLTEPADASSSQHNPHLVFLFYARMEGVVIATQEKAQ